MQPMIDAFIGGWKRSFDYTGRTKRAEFWWFALASAIVSVVLLIPSSGTSAISNFFGTIYSLYAIASIVPGLPLAVRRLRDIGKPWPWILIGLIPLIGAIWLIVLYAQPSIA
ncbi:DUF805 domain-containing protein [Synechococcus sp. J7-Johnson]|jgi:uncharacterized membrane protein YhaH (DUF805 family)|nr:DUF805 domain-containing protein [Synechococcus sp. J7-Johnson]